MQVTTSINNIIVGKLNIDHGGIMAVRNPTHGLAAKMKFKQPGLLQFRGEAHVVSLTSSFCDTQFYLPTSQLEQSWLSEILAPMQSNRYNQVYTAPC
jgi:hypothetical protein